MMRPSGVESDGVELGEVESGVTGVTADAVESDAAECDAEYDGQYDVLIVGGGLVGASLAVALEGSGLSLAVVEAVAADSGAQPSFDERTVALTYRARQIYTGLGVWQAIAAQQAQPIAEIHVSDRGHFGMTHLRHSDVGLEALGYVVPTRVIGQVLHRRMRRSEAVALLCPATVEGLRPQPREVVVRVSQDRQTMTLRARLVVLADGGRSALLGLVGGRVGSQIGEQTAGRVNEQTGDQTGGQIGEQTGEQIDGQTGDKTESCTF